MYLYYFDCVGPMLPIFNSVPNSCCAKAHDDICNTNIVFDNEINVNVD